MASLRALSGLAVAMSAVLVACGEEPEPLITEEALREGTYLTQFAEEGRVTLSDGQYTAPSVEATADLAISLGPYALGDLNADKQPDAALVLVERIGQLQTFYNLHAVLAADSALSDVAWVLLGEQPTRVSEVRVDSGLIHVDLLGPGGEEPAGREDARTLTYALTDKGLRRMHPTTPATRDPATTGGAGSSILLTGVEWKLVSIETEDEVVTPVFSGRGDPALVFTREFGDPRFGSGRVSGMAGCNRIFGNYRIGPADSLSISSIATTYMSCPEPVMEIEGLLVRALELMRTYRRDGDELLLEFVDGRLRFALADD